VQRKRRRSPGTGPRRRRSDLDALVAVFGRLRAPGGCPWDRERTLRDLGPYLLGECREAVAAMRKGDADNLREECGDLLANLVFTVELARERGWFDMKAVVDGACAKLVRRHPHVFGSASAATPEEVEAQWQRIKTKERRAKAAAAARSARRSRRS
jgi:uncharacterized protein YabN with tetrapyrrole methylase and pyrophosphatase domain